MIRSFVFGALLLLVMNGFAQKGFTDLSKTKRNNIKPLRSDAVLTVGDWALWLYDNGSIAFYNEKGSKAIFPKNTAPLIYQQGLMWGGWVKDAQTGQKLDSIPRVGGIYYKYGLQPGWIQQNGQPVDANDPAIRVYFIRKDWQQLTDLQLKQEAAYYFDTDTTAVTQKMMDDLKSVLAKNWKDWPVDLGAPYVDVNHNGIYDPVRTADGYPDPTQGDYPGIAQADQVIWLSAYEIPHDSPIQGKVVPIIGLELQITAWTYKGSLTPLSQTVFVRYRLINKTQYFVDSMYVGIFSDPDIGFYNDDLVGCDTTRDLWFAYNGYPQDAEFEKFGLTPPALGYTLLAGPMVPGDDPGDEAWQNFQWYQRYKNLNLSSFTYFIPSAELGDFYLPWSIDFALSWYNILRGYIPTSDIKNPIPYVIGSGPRKGEPTRFPLSGDPVSDPNGVNGDVDGAYTNIRPGDRTMNGNTGPFTLRPGEEQEMLIAISGGLGTNNRNGINGLRAMSDLCKTITKENFENLDFKPAPPHVKASSTVDEILGNSIILDWGWDSQRISETEDRQIGSLKFEGYIVYQLPSPQASLKDPQVVRIATFDRKDDVYQVYDWEKDAKSGHLVYVPFVIGKNSGIARHLILNKDYIHGKPLYRSFTYYFAVTAYNYDANTPEKQRGYESDPTIVSVTVGGPNPGTRYEAKLKNELNLQTNQKSDVICKVQVIDPSATTGHDYEVFFTRDADSASTTYGQWLWNLEDKTLNKVVLKNQKIHILSTKQIYGDTTKHFENIDEVTADGLALYVQAPKPAFKCIVEVINQQGPLPDSQYDLLGSPCKGNNVWHSLSAPADSNRFYLSAGSGNGTIDQIEKNLINGNSHDLELRFTERGGLFLWWDDPGNPWAQVPFEFWDVGYGTYQDSTDDVRLITGGSSGGSTPGVFDFGYTDPALGFPATDWISARKPLNAKGSYEAFAHDVTSGALTKAWWENSIPILENLIICDYDGARTLPETGTVIRFVTTKGPKEDLKFWFTAPGRIENDLKLAKKDVEKINVFPNPFYAGIQWSPSRMGNVVTFNHLPQHAIIRVFSLDGYLVKKMEKNDKSQFLKWNLSNRAGMAIASGLYIIRIEMPELKKTKVLKLMVIQSE